MASVSLKGVCKRYPGGVDAVIDFNINIRDKEFIILVGPSGCGKSTTLRMMAGLEEITEGELYIDNRLVNDVAPKDRDVAMVFQNYALYPHMTVFENMAFGLKLRKVPKSEIKRLVQEAARVLDIQHLLDRKPRALSGGQRQRVALGRAIVRDPQVFLLDEPLSNLDAKLRTQMRTELSKLHKKLGTTFIYVTHDQVEAMTMGDRIVVMKDGYIQQIDSPVNLYANPVNKFVAGFIGSPQMNFVTAKLIMVQGRYTLEFGSEDTKSTRGRKFYVEIPMIRQGAGHVEKIDEDTLAHHIDKEVILGIRPENIRHDAAFVENAKTGIIEAVVEVTEMMGAETFLYVNCEGIPLTVRISGGVAIRPQDTVKLAVDASAVHLFDIEDEHSLLN